MDTSSVPRVSIFYKITHRPSRKVFARPWGSHRTRREVFYLAFFQKSERGKGRRPLKAAFLFCFFFLCAFATKEKRRRSEAPLNYPCVTSGEPPARFPLFAKQIASQIHPSCAIRTHKEFRPLRRTDRIFRFAQCQVCRWQTLSGGRLATSLPKGLI